MGRPPLRPGEHGTIHTQMIRRGSWVATARFRDLDGITRRVRAGGASKQGSVAALQDKLKSRRISGGRIEAETTVRDLAGMWIDQKDANQSTLDAYRRTLATVVVPRIGSMTLNKISTGSIDLFLEGVEAISERKRSRTVLSQMFSLAVRWDAITVNPVRDALPIQAAKEPTKALSVADLMELRADVLAWALEHPRQAWMRDAVEVFVGTGYRPGELLGLQWDNLLHVPATVSVDGETVVEDRLACTVSGTVKRDSVNGLHRQAKPKSAAGERATVLPLFAVDALDRVRASADLPTGGRLIFPARGGGPMEPANFRRLWREVRGEKWAHVQPRSFRTAVATLIARSAGSQAAADQLGHASDEITKKHYIEKNHGPVDNTMFMGGLIGEAR